MYVSVGVARACLLRAWEKLELKTFRLAYLAGNSLFFCSLVCFVYMEVQGLLLPKSQLFFLSGRESMA